MSPNFSERFQHICFQRRWNLNDTTLRLLGQCEGYVDAISLMPVLPEVYSQLLNVSLIKGAQATTAIEGNVLTEKEIEEVTKGKELPPSKAYQATEVTNVLDALNELLEEVVMKNVTHQITPDLLKRFNKMIGQNLGEYFDGVPGIFRPDVRAVGPYRCPDPQDVPELINSFCEWLKAEFGFVSGQQPFHVVVIEAIVAHVYFEWIHPFGDGNGRTGRLLEFYILLRGGNPDLASHILSNHYNETRPRYYEYLNRARLHNNLTEFIEYALLGFRDGLKETLKTLQGSQFTITWQKLIYDKFSDVNITHKDVFKRRRELMLAFPIDTWLSISQIKELNIKIGIMYAPLSRKTLERDLNELERLELITREGNMYRANDYEVRNYSVRKKPNIRIKKRRDIHTVSNL